MVSADLEGKKEAPSLMNGFLGTWNAKRGKGKKDAMGGPRKKTWGRGENLEKGVGWWGGPGGVRSVLLCAGGGVPFPTTWGTKAKKKENSTQEKLGEE